MTIFTSHFAPFHPSLQVQATVDLDTVVQTPCNGTQVVFHVNAFVALTQGFDVHFSPSQLASHCCVLIG